MNLPEYERYLREVHLPTDHFPFTAFGNRLPDDFLQLPLHCHKEIEFLYLRSGAAVVTIDLEPYSLAPGEIAILLPGQLHTLSVPEGCQANILSISFPLELLLGSQANEDTRFFFDPLLNGRILLPQLITREISCCSALADCMEKAYEIYRFFPLAYTLAIRSQLYQIFYILFYNDLKSLPKSRPAKSVRKAKFILEQLQTRYSEHLTIEQMASECSLSESHFMKFFKSVFGVPFTDYLCDYRIGSAANKLLALPLDTSVSDIARDCGFQSISYFNRRFKEHYQVSPTQFRSQAVGKPQTSRK